MTDANTDVIQGTLDLLIFKTLSGAQVEPDLRGCVQGEPGVAAGGAPAVERARWLDSKWRETQRSRKAKRLQSNYGVATVEGESIRLDSYGTYRRG
jgi:PadR family transcriptional regulator, regulatory protein PadR